LVSVLQSSSTYVNDASRTPQPWGNVAGLGIVFVRIHAVIQIGRIAFEKCGANGRDQRMVAAAFGALHRRRGA
jgi:hypothetical protein